MNRFVFHTLQKYALPIFVGVALGATATPALAQGMQFGLFGAPAINSLGTNQPRTETESKVFFNFGFISEWHFDERYSFATGIELSQRGGNLRLSDTLNASYRSNFIEVPLTLKMRTQEFGRMTYFGRFGSGLSFRTNERSEFTPELPANEELDNYVSFLNMQLNIGGGLEYNIGGTSRLTAELLYSQALFNSLNTDFPRLDDKYHYRLNNLALRLGILF